MYLYDAKNISCTLDKPYLTQRIRNFPDNAVTQTVPKTDHYVFDGEHVYSALNRSKDTTTV